MNYSKPSRNWRDIAAAAATEHDTAKLIALTEELNRALEELQ